MKLLCQKILKVINQVTQNWTIYLSSVGMTTTYRQFWKNCCKLWLAFLASVTGYESKLPRCVKLQCHIILGFFYRSNIQQLSSRCSWVSKESKVSALALQREIVQIAGTVLIFWQNKLFCNLLGRLFLTNLALSFMDVK